MEKYSGPKGMTAVGKVVSMYDDGRHIMLGGDAELNLWQCKCGFYFALDTRSEYEIIFSCPGCKLQQHVNNTGKAK